jgi:hypothetical protein
MVYAISSSSHLKIDRLCGLVVRVPGYRGPGLISCATRFSEK